ncbi:MAG: BREX-1 system adenine-specific DNA-methyltransferase PglX [Calditrichaceae bacterium]|nr:BREX-1 system adenine-specific DNA-methyltransferase PglX [Calditrichia bacterium]NUQ43057.1 BREX-1 system adenine-specific DNA-methyltransferase PglX [Calditrichaceae bacterium]
MNKNALKTFARAARRKLLEQVKSKLHYVLTTDSAELRNKADQIKELKKQIAASSEAEVVERVAYTWFNRLMALRFMDANDYTTVKVVSPPEGFTLPEILSEAKKGHFEEDLRVDRQKINDLLDGKIPARDPQNEVYQMLLTAACNRLHRTMPFMFEPINDYSELLMPEDLLSETSLRAEMVKHLPAEDCQNVEIIGWLYQFYIAEKKDEVFAGLKKNVKISAENIPAATQLFTPHWIVRYLVENSLGRLWLLNRPNSGLKAHMEYYVESEPESDFLKINSPEDLKILDPACGSGHILVYAFDLLVKIYEEEGYAPTQIPALILQNNLYGLEIDDRAASLAAFALVMKARAYHRRFLENPAQPHILSLQNIRFSEAELNEYMRQVKTNLFTANLKEALQQFSEAKTFGSLIRPCVSSVEEIKKELQSKNLGGNLFLAETHRKVLQALPQIEYLSREYHCVITNPPYMSGGGMDDRLKTFLAQNYSDVKSDLFSSFIIRNCEFAKEYGHLGFMTPFVWMFIASYEKLRQFIIEEKTITSLIQLEYSGFDGATVPICTFTIENFNKTDYRGGYIRLSDFRGADKQAPKTLEAIKNPNCGWFYRTSAADFKKIPGSPIAYWVSEKFVNPFVKADQFIHDLTISDGQTKTGDNDRFLRQHWEVSSYKVGSKGKWWHHPKGGPYRKWYGNVDCVIDWSEDARKHYRKDRVARILPEYLWDKKGISWTLITSGEISFRVLEPNQIFNLAAPSLFFYDEGNISKCLGFLNTKYVAQLLKVINPTLNMNVGEVRSLPFLSSVNSKIDRINTSVDDCISISREDWNSYETSWDFTELPLLQTQFRQKTLSATYIALRQHWQSMTEEMQRLEEENNRIFIEAYGLQEELTPEVSLEEITLTCNPHYRYGEGKNAVELEKLLRADTMRELLSYAVGCMFGRYSLDKPGLVLANQCETLEDYLKQIPQPRFSPDKDNIIPILEDEYFSDDVVGRFKEFLKVSFGEEHFAENLRFIEQALGKDIRKYFVREFYNDHVKRYKKRPIYWLFSSPNRSFNALIYMHRYRPDTVSRLLNEYLREYITKLEARRAHLQTVSTSESVTGREKNQALKEIARIEKVLKELAEYERTILAPLAKQKIEIDLDDGVKVNYGKFGKALYPIAGL